MTSDETKLFFSSAYTNYYAVGEVNCADGSLNQYIATSNVTVNGKIRNQYILSTEGRDFLTTSGDLISPTYNAPAALLSLSNNTMTSYMYPNYGNTTHLSKRLDFQYWDSSFMFDVFLNSNSEIELFLRIVAQSTLAAAWHHNIT